MCVIQISVTLQSMHISQHFRNFYGQINQLQKCSRKKSSEYAVQHTVNNLTPILSQLLTGFEYGSVEIQNYLLKQSRIQIKNDFGSIIICTLTLDPGLNLDLHPIWQYFGIQSRLCLRKWYWIWTDPKQVGLRVEKVQKSVFEGPQLQFRNFFSLLFRNR